MTIHVLDWSNVALVISTLTKSLISLANFHYNLIIEYNLYNFQNNFHYRFHFRNYLGKLRNYVNVRKIVP